MPFPKITKPPMGAWIQFSPLTSMGTPWEHFRADGCSAALVNRGGLREKQGAGAFESLLHRHILQTQTPDFPRESRGFVVSGVWKKARGTDMTGALFWCAVLQGLVSVVAVLI